MRIDLLYTGKHAHLHKPRLFLGSVIWRDLHWAKNRTQACLAQFGRECKPCGPADRYAFFAAVLLERVEHSQADPLLQWRALPDEERQRRIAEKADSLPAVARGSLNIETLCVADMNVAAKSDWQLGERVVQCLPEWGVEDEAEDLRGLTARIVVTNRQPRLRWEKIRIDDVPADFDPQPIFDRRYGLRHLSREPDGDPNVLKFRRQA